MDIDRLLCSPSHFGGSIDALRPVLVFMSFAVALMWSPIALPAVEKRSQVPEETGNRLHLPPCFFSLFDLNQCYSLYSLSSPQQVIDCFLAYAAATCVILVSRCA